MYPSGRRGAEQLECDTKPGYRRIREPLNATRVTPRISAQRELSAFHGGNGEAVPRCRAMAVNATA
jgi:hypothetical protein